MKHITLEITLDLVYLDWSDRLKWLAHLEFSHNKESSDLTWDNVEHRLPRTDKLRSMVREGIPHSLRPQLWLRLSGELTSGSCALLMFKLAYTE